MTLKQQGYNTFSPSDVAGVNLHNLEGSIGNQAGQIRLLLPGTFQDIVVAGDSQPVPKQRLHD